MTTLTTSLAAARVPVTNSNTLVLQIRRLADEAEGEQRRKLRDLAVRAERLAQDLTAAVS